MDGLEMPDEFAGRRVERKGRVGIEIIAAAIAAVEIGSGGAGPKEYHAPFFIQGEAAPSVGAADVLISFLVLVSLVTRLARMGNGMKRPADLPGVNVVRPDVAGGSLRAFGETRSNDDQVLIYDPRACHGDV